MTTPENSNYEKLASDVRNHVHYQILGAVDSIRSEAAWLKILAEIPPKVIAKALAMQLTHRNYQEVTRCRCCCK